MDRINERVSRLTAVNRLSGFFEILQPEEYLERGAKVLRDLEHAIDAMPRRDVEYPDMHTRYTNPNVRREMGTHLQEFDGDDDTELILSDPKLRIDIQGNHWSHYDICSKGAVAKFAREGMGQPRAVAALHVSVTKGTIVIPYTSTAEDLDIPGVNAPRLFCSELIYQAWRDACIYEMNRCNSQISRLSDLKYIVVTTIANDGTLWSIRDVLAAKGLPEAQTAARQPQTVTLEDPSSIEFKILMGTVNGKPIARMCADHASTLGGKCIAKIHVWWPYGRYAKEQGGALAFELSEIPPLRWLKRTPTMRDKIKAKAKEVFGSFNCAT